MFREQKLEPFLFHIKFSLAKQKKAQAVIGRDGALRYCNPWAKQYTELDF